MKYYAPKNIDEAVTLLNNYKNDRTIILAGGTDVIAKQNCQPENSGWIRDNDSGKSELLSEEHMIYLGCLDLNYIKHEGENIHIGSFTSLSELLYSPIIKRYVPVLKEAISQIAGISIRNIATLGGNIMNASPAADSIPALMVCDAKLILTGINGDRVIPVSEFFIGPGKTVCEKNEMLKEIAIPACEGNTKFVKIGRRKAESLSLVNGAARVVLNDGKCSEVRLAVGAVASTPLRLKRVEEMMKGKVASDQLIQDVLNSVSELIDPITDKRSTASYRKDITKVLVRRLLMEVCQ